MRKNQLSIHSENLLPIIKKWLYTDRDIFVRELISNGTDAVTKFQLLSQKAEPPALSVQIDRKNKALHFSDNGIGMTEEEVEKYIAQIAFSSAEEFVQKHKEASDSVIGHFGLGFYSAYMVAERVEIQTLSYQPGSTPVFWRCDGSSSYEIGPGSRTERGTTVSLFLNPESLEYLEEHKVRSLLEKHCSFMPYPLRLNETVLPRETPLWTKSPAECTEQEYKALHRKLAPFDPEPLFWIHLNVDTPFRLQGILYFPKTERTFHPPKTSIHLYCNKVFVSDTCKEIVPDYLNTLHGVLDSPDIPLNVSRSTLQLDAKVRQLSAHIAKKVADRLVSLFTQDRAQYVASWPDIEPFVKIGLLQDDKFYERIKDTLLWKNTKGEWMTLSEYPQGEAKKIYYAPADRATALLQLYKEKNQEILLTSSSLDAAVIPFLESKLSLSFQRIDGALDSTLLDPSREKGILDAEGKSEAGRLASFIRSALGEKELEVEAKSLSSDTLPALLLLDEQERRHRDYLALAEGKGTFSPVGKKSFIVNTNHPLIQSIGKLQEKSPEAASALAQGVYGLSLLAHRELDPQNIEEILQKQHLALEHLSKQAILK